jgi:hypothetical protein
MEPLSAIALAGNILQFVETVSHLISAGQQISDIGATREQVELTTIATELRSLVSRVTLAEAPAGKKLSDEEASIRALGAQCDQVAQELLAVLETLKVKRTEGSLKYAESFYKALLAEWKKPKVDALQERLDRISAATARHLASYDSGKILRRLEEMTAQDRVLRAHRVNDLVLLQRDMRDIFTGIEDKLRKQETRNQTMQALLTAAASGSRYSAEQIILEQLRFDEIDYRFDAIRRAHEQTLSWLFGDVEQRSPATFDEWLSSEDDLYWISGKPGSGKSTLMKYLCEHPRTTELLNSWSKDKRLISASYFFWDAGKPLQKSQEGLLRSLLFEILRKCPDMIAEAYPRTWRLFASEPVDPTSSNNENGTLAVTPSVPALLETIRNLGTVAAESGYKFCFFIDGIDEYEGQPSDMIDLMRILRTMSNVKICVSSRPWNEFEREFGFDSSRKIYMQDFNGKDINAYVNDTFEKDENYQELEDRAQNGQPLIDEIVQAANGVFFWVYLVVKSFQEGLENGDRAADLRERLRMLPKDLNEYFRRIILSDVAEFYHEHSAEMFRVTIEGEEEIPLIAYWFIREDPQYVLDMERKPLTVQQVNKRTKDTVKRLNAACKGLLETRHVDNPSTPGDVASLPSSILFDRKVGFLHRTVREYLMLEETRQILDTWSSKTFEPHETICKILLAQIKSSPDEADYSSRINHLEGRFNQHFSKNPGRAACALREDLTQAMGGSTSLSAALLAGALPETTAMASSIVSTPKSHPPSSAASKTDKSTVQRLLGGMRRKFHKAA